MSFLQRLARRKVLTEEEKGATDLDRCLSLFDLILLGIGSTLGAGLYVVIGQVGKDVAGPAVTLSFFVAAITSAFAGLCYAEFAARIPRAGSAYVYSYVTVGELVAFIIGWNLILEYVIGTASVARAASSYFDNLIGNRMSDFFKSHMPMHVDQLSEYPDIFALAITLILTGLLIAGVKESARFNNFFTCVNLLVVLYVTICGLFKLNTHNWSLSQEEVPVGYGKGGFMPYGFSGAMAGAATCFYAFVGFDCVATTGEETKNPQKTTPIAIVVSLFVICLAYCGVSAIVTLMCPYYLLDPNAALPAIFERAGWGVARYLVAIGALSALLTSLMGAMFPLPRILYAMGTDGVIFRFLGAIHPRFHTPVLGTALSGIFAGVMAMVFSLKQLVEMMSIGTLLAYTLVSVSVLLLRYETDASLPVVFVTGECLVLIKLFDTLETHGVWVVVLACVMGLGILICCVIIVRQPQSQAKLSFKVPLVPWIPILSVLVNIYLMLKLSTLTWARFGVWMFIGFLIYFGYGIRQAGTVVDGPDSDNSATVRDDRPASPMETDRLLPHSTATRELDGKYMIQ
ncbi:cationic amino acid transporter 2-like [Elysia marginata]|uniref:Cationic amino acid transporter 2-like n=1 Tax=Elysia marginata TaxID=1093978 RepID=A0AAV4J588_9GAST|nr:cationic amino acid transporter 2-like [Elysia marginata]